jgi:hypothetical protein
MDDLFLFNNILIIKYYTLNVNIQLVPHREHSVLALERQVGECRIEN